VNSTADAINVRELEKLPPTPFKVYQASDWGEDQFVAELLPKITLFPDRLPLRIGAQVMLLKNQPAQKLWNGSRGVVIGFINPATEADRYTFIEALPKGVKRPELLPVVRFSTGQEVAVSIESYELEGLGKHRIRARRSQIPLRLSWAITIHKSQGMSLDFLKVDASRSFEAGQAYVALSRARSIEGLQVLSFDERKCWCDPKVVEFYKSSIKPLTDPECNLLSGPRNRSSKTAAKRKASTDWIPVAPLVPNYSAAYAFASIKADIPPLPQRISHRQIC
jgi:ATP-dependent DNA helicase PIF1